MHIKCIKFWQVLLELNMIMARTGVDVHQNFKIIVNQALSA